MKIGRTVEVGQWHVSQKCTENNRKENFEQCLPENISSNASRLL